MIDYKLVANIFSDFMGAYTGKNNMAIRDLFRRYGDNKLFLAMIGNLDVAQEIPITLFLRDVYEILKPYRSRLLSDKEWEKIVHDTTKLNEKYKNNLWSRQIILEFLDLLERDDKELRELEDDGSGDQAA